MPDSRRPRDQELQESQDRGRFSWGSAEGFGPDLVKIGRRKLRIIDFATRLEDLRSPPRNLLETLKGKRKGQHSIRINDQFRICFVWTDSGADEVEITDYHDE